MRVLTFNVNSIRSRQKVVEELLFYRDIDVACLQEIKVVEEKFPQFPPFQCLVNGQKQYNGVAVCSRLPIEKFQIGFEGEQGESRFIYTQIGNYHIINIYAPLGDLYQKRFKYKMEFYRQLEKFIEQRFDLRRDFVILCGDLNIAHREVDVWNSEEWKGKVTFLPEERKEMDRLLEMGFIDVVRSATPKPIFTFYDYRGGAVYKNHGLRLDYVLISTPLLPKTHSIELLLNVRKRRDPKPSDHVPLIVEFK